MNPPQETTLMRNVRSPKSKIRKKKNIGSKAEHDVVDSDTPFCKEELATLEEFEALDKSFEQNADLRDQSGKKETKPEQTARPKPKIKRRRQIDPATCERDYSSDELEFMNALSEYKRNSGRMFPTCSEILEVLKGLGYEKAD